MSSPIARHPDGTDCYTRDCSRGQHLPLLNAGQAVAQHDVGAFLDAKAAEDKMSGGGYEPDPSDSDTSETFLTDKASAVGDAAKRMKEEIEANGGKMEFPALYDLNGNLQHAFLVNGQFGPVWKVMDKSGEYVDKWVSASKAQNPKTRKANYEKKGYRVGRVKSPAYVRIEGNGTGMGSMHTVHANLRQYNNAKLEDMEVLDDGSDN